MLIKSLNIDSFSPISTSSTYLKMENVSEKTQVFGFDAFSNVDQCCPQPTDFNLQELLSEIDDTVERVPCDISRETFLTKFVKRKKLAILTECKNAEKFVQKWDLEEFFTAYGDFLWDTNYGQGGGRVQITGETVLEHIKRNTSLIVFDRLMRRTNLLR